MFDYLSLLSHFKDAAIHAPSFVASFLPAVDTSLCNTGEVRLVGRPSYGRVEVCVGRKWGTVCSAQFDRLDAAVICRQLDLPTEGVLLVISKASSEL